ncbi:MAG: hypothetical protein E8D45_02210 [Nitrospira sp.]|nr:MAG: hypothetical protein E8D45_02210 [Nitrospira sp.]
MIHLMHDRATKEQIADMLSALCTYIKLAVDIERGVLAGGGTLHADCEAALLEDGSRQADVWGADWIPSLQEVTYESLLNIRPRQNNPSLEILDHSIREKVSQVVRRVLG